MNIVDSTGWLEYFADGRNADFFAAAVEDVERLLVPSICVLEVCGRVLEQAGENEALQAIALMRQGRLVDLDTSLAVNAARLGEELGLSLLDSVVLATARLHGATVWTQGADLGRLDGVRFISQR